MTQGYIGTKAVLAWPENRDDVEGYAVKYEDGYISWSPKETFERSYHPVTAMDFGAALFMLKRGNRVARAGWNGKGMWLVHVSTWNADFGGDLPPDWYARDFIAMKSADSGMVPWLASQTDMLAEDWMVVS